MTYLKLIGMFLVTVILLAVVIVPFIVGGLAALCVGAVWSGWIWFQEAFDRIDQFWTNFIEDL